MNARKATGESQKLFIGYDVFIYAFIAFANASLLLQYIVSGVSQDLVFIALAQSITGLIGIGLGGMAARGKYEIGLPSERRGQYIEALMIAAMVMVFDSFVMQNVSQTSLSGLIESSNIPLTASVVEELAFSFGFSYVLYIAFDKIWKGKSMKLDFVAALLASLFSAALFAWIHLNVYRANPEFLYVLFINRLIYSLEFLRTKNLGVPILMHLFHNGAILFMVSVGL